MNHHRNGHIAWMNRNGIGRLQTDRAVSECACCAESHIAAAAFVETAARSGARISEGNEVRLIALGLTCPREMHAAV
jgi:hypothetical protein